MSTTDYQSISQEKWYSPNNKVEFTNKKFTVFSAEDCKEKRFVPWEVKESTFKNMMGIVGVNMVNMVLPLGPTLTIASAIFAGNYVYTIFNLMNNAVTKVELHEDGQRVVLTFGRTHGRQETVNIRDISKAQHERSLVETFEESSMFPMNVGGKTVFLHGPGQEAIKHGEVFRAIVNGQSIKA